MRASPLPHSRRPGRELLRVRVAGEQRGGSAAIASLRRPVERHLALPQQHGAVAEPLDGLRVVRDEDDRAAAVLELGDLAEALALELLVADREHLVEQQHIGLDVRRDGEAEPHVHPRRVGAHGQVDELLELRERDDLVHRLAHAGAREAVDRAVQVDVLAPGEVGVEAGAELEQRRDAAAGLDAAARRLDDPRDEPQQRRLARAVAPDEPDRLAGLDDDRDVAQRLHLARAEPPAGDEHVLERALRLRVDAEASARPGRRRSASLRVTLRDGSSPWTRSRASARKIAQVRPGSVVGAGRRGRG